MSNRRRSPKSPGQPSPTVLLDYPRLTVTIRTFSGGTERGRGSRRFTPARALGSRALGSWAVKKRISGNQSGASSHEENACRSDHFGSGSGDCLGRGDHPPRFQWLPRFPRTGRLERCPGLGGKFGIARLTRLEWLAGLPRQPGLPWFAWFRRLARLSQNLPALWLETPPGLCRPSGRTESRGFFFELSGQPLI